MLNQKPPDFELPASGHKVIRLSASKGKFLAIYLYPKDNKPGCTCESQLFRDRYREKPANSSMRAKIWSLCNR